MKKKSIIAVCLATAMIMSALPGCGSTGGKVAESQEQTSQEEVLQETTPASENEAVMDQPEKKMTYVTCITPQQSGYISMENIVKMYQEQVNPNFSVDIQYIADKPAYLQKIKTLVASNEAPDMFNLDTDPYAIKLLDQGIVVDLSETLDKYGLKDVFLPAPLGWGDNKGWQTGGHAHRFFN